MGFHSDDPSENVEWDQLLSEEDATMSSSDIADSSSLLSENSDDFWKSFVTSSPVEDLVKGDSGSIPKENQQQLGKGGTESCREDSIELSNPQTASSNPGRPNNWKPEEILKLIKTRGELDSRFQVVKGRMVLWKEISANLLGYGINRTPVQCKSRWASLVRKYEGIKSGEKSKKDWSYFDEMDKILSDC